MRIHLLAVVIAFYAVPLAAMRFAFVVVDSAERPIEDAEVCVFQALGDDPVTEWFGGSDIRCFAATTILAMPPGRWNVFGRRDGAYVGSFPLRIPIVDTPENTDTGFKRVQLQVAPAARVSISTELSEQGRLAAYVPSTATAPALVLPGQVGQRYMDVPAATPFVPVLLAGNQIRRIGTLHLGLLAGAKELLHDFDAPVEGTVDVITALRQRPIAREYRPPNDLPAPTIELCTPQGATVRAMVPTQAARHRDLLIFKGVPATTSSAVISVRGKTWLPLDTTTLLRRDGGIAYGDTVAMEPASAISLRFPADTKQWLEPLMAAICRAPGREYESTIELRNCEATPCTTVRTIPLRALADLMLAPLPAGKYTLVLNSVLSRHVWSQDLVASPGEHDLTVSPPANFLSGRIHRRGDGIIARITAGANSTLTDATGGFMLRTGDSELRTLTIRDCGEETNFAVLLKEPLKLNDIRDFELPAPLHVLVTNDASPPIPIPDASVSVQVIDDPATRLIRFSDGGQRTDQHGNITLRTTPLADFAVCAEAKGHEHACASVKAGQERVVLALKRAATLSGSFENIAPVERGVLFVVSVSGVVMESAAITREGSFELHQSHNPSDYCVIVAANRPLTLLPFPADLQGIMIPPTPIRSFRILLPAREAREIALTVGGRLIPASAFSRHQAFRGFGTLTTNGELVVADIAESGQIIAIRGFSLNDRPANVPAHLDVFAMPEYRAHLVHKALLAGRTDITF